MSGIMDDLGILVICTLCIFLTVFIIVIVKSGI